MIELCELATYVLFRLCDVLYLAMSSLFSVDVVLFLRVLIYTVLF